MVSLLTEHKKLIEPAFSADSFAENEAQKLIESYYASDLKPLYFNDGGYVQGKTKAEHHKPFSSDDHTADLILHIVGEVKLFAEALKHPDAVALLGGEVSRPLHSCNNTLIALFFDKLASCGLVSNTWQAEVARKQLIISSTGKKYLTQHDLSSSLNRLRMRELTMTERRLVRLIERGCVQLRASE